MTGRRGAEPTAPTEGEEDARLLAAGRRLFSADCHFLLSVAAPEQVPDSLLPEVAFAGRSNVGKSSLLNALTGRAGLAKASNRPGRTQLLNFFSLDERLFLVDLPGYGYAEAPKTAVRRWTQLTRAYLRGRPQLRRVLLLIDARHGLKPADREVMALLDQAAVPYQGVLTKADKLSPLLAQRRLAETGSAFSRHLAAHPRLLLTSAVQGIGLDPLRAELAGLVEAPPDGDASPPPRPVATRGS